MKTKKITAADNYCLDPAYFGNIWTSLEGDTFKCDGPKAVPQINLRNLIKKANIAPVASEKPKESAIDEVKKKPLPAPMPAFTRQDEQKIKSASELIPKRVRIPMRSLIKTPKKRNKK